jgi:hypothetical protein
MLAAAVRPWVRIYGRSGTLTVEFGDRARWRPRWALDIRDSMVPVSLWPPPKDSPLIGDLRWSWRSRAAIERTVQQGDVRRAAEKAANDSKAAA